MPAFDAEVLIATAEIDAVFAEDFVLRPYAKNADKRASDAPDPTRAVVRLVGLWRDKLANPVEPRAYDTREYRRPGTAGDVPHVEFSASATAAFVNFEIRDGDHIERGATQTAYRARTATVSANGTVTVPLNYLGSL